MKPKNFPGRKNSRRITAIERLGKRDNLVCDMLLLKTQEYVMDQAAAEAIHPKTNRIVAGQKR